MTGGRTFIRRSAPWLGMLLLAFQAGAQSFDTSEWICEFCPFQNGASSRLAVGATVASDDSAYFGDATGYDEEGVYANVDGDGVLAGETYRIRWLVEDLLMKVSKEISNSSELKN